jgi:hypothetical protein
MNFQQQLSEVLSCPLQTSEPAAGLVGLGRIGQFSQGMYGSAPTTAVDPVFNAA